MARTIIDIPDPQLHGADRLCKRLGISRAELIRRALAAYMQSLDEVRTDGFGLWLGAQPAPEIANTEADAVAQAAKLGAQP